MLFAYNFKPAQPASLPYIVPIHHNEKQYTPLGNKGKVGALSLNENRKRGNSKSNNKGYGLNPLMPLGNPDQF